MSTVYLDRKHLEIDVTGGCLTVSPAPRGRGSIPLNLITRLVLCGRVRLNSAALAGLSDRGIAVICLAGRNHRRVAQLGGVTGNDARRRIDQFKVGVNPALRLLLARQVVAAKIRAALREIELLLDRRPALRRHLVKARRTLIRITAQIDQAELDSLLGLEGAAAAAWFRALSAVFPESLGFKGRNRRPPRDPVNAVLSLAYTLLHAEAVAACYGHGLDPMLGFLHEPAPGRESLACDLIEPLRPRVDGRVVELFASQGLEETHLTHSDAGCRLDKTGRRHFYQWWETIAPSYRRYLRTGGHQLIHRLSELVQ
ncbi:MAG: CRISPR-associated endonuclease Cas1 [Xanthomonadales bacterium]|nr:CRISPR-associated endonuclease Cas1 [Xanthomonadales bacterium]